MIMDNVEGEKTTDGNVILLGESMTPLNCTGYLEFEVLRKVMLKEIGWTTSSLTGFRC
jgi:hypothetical protein